MTGSRDYRAHLLNAVAHELSTPLTPIRLQLFVVRRRLAGLDDEMREAFQVIDRNVERLHGLVKGVLEASRLDSDRFPVRMQPIDLGALVQETVLDYHLAAEEAGVRLEAHAEAGPRLEADPERINQVMHHLIRNALRHTPEGGAIDVRARRRGHWAEAEVEDTGVGFTQEDHAKIFQPFAQVSPTRPDTHDASGLGLYISRGIIELHGGTMWARSGGPGRGATFGFRIPIRPGTGGAAASRQKVEAFSQRIRDLI